MEYESIRVIQGYAYWIITILLCVALYGYIFYMYRAQKTGKHDYEKYARLALDDRLDSTIIEKRETQKEI